jgi:hypothetical protein
MLEFYTLSFETYHNDKFMGGDSTTILIDEDSAPDLNCSTDLDWENLDFVYPTCGIMLPFSIYRSNKKGRVISWYDCSLFNRNTWDIKEWKAPLNITIKSSTRKRNMSIAEVLKWHDADKAIQYLKEKGLTIDIK